MDKRWKIKKPDGNVYGPVDTITIKKWIQEKRISEQDYISPEDNETWQIIKSVQEFAEIIQQSFVTPDHRPSPVEPTFKIKNPNGEEYGPATFQTITQWLKEKKIGEGTLVQKTEGGQWFSLNELPRLFASSTNAGIQDPHLKTEDINAKVKKIVSRIRLSVSIIAVILFMTILIFGIKNANYLNRGTTVKEGANYWEHEGEVASSGETVTVPAGTFNDCYKTVYSVDIFERGKRYNIEGQRWDKIGVGPIKEEFSRYESSEDFNPFNTINFSGELISYKGPKAGEKPFPYIRGAQLEYNLTAKIDAPGPLEVLTDVVAPPQNFKINITCSGTITLEDGKKYLKITSTAGGPLTRSEEFYRIEGDDVFFYGTRYMRNVSSPVKAGTLQPKEVGTVLKNKITFDGTYSSTKQAKNVVSSFIMGRLGFLSGVMMILSLLGFIASLKHNVANLEENIEQLIIASREKGDTLTGEILGNVVSWTITLIFFGAFSMFAVFTFMSFF